MFASAHPKGRAVLQLRNGVLRVIPSPWRTGFVWRHAVNSRTERNAMTRNNWIACAILASAATIGACSPKGGQAGQPDRAQDQAYQGSDTNRLNDRTAANRTDRTTGEKDKTARDRSDMPVSYTVPTGTHINLTTNDELSSRKNKPGDTFTAKVVD